MDSTLIKICEVISVTDINDGGRVKVRMLPEDSKFTNDELPYAFPLLPKMLHLKPKVGESVLVMKMDINNGYNQRFYIGPIISQPQFMNKDSYNIGGQTLLGGSIKAPAPAPSTNPQTNGAYPQEDDVSLSGRGDTDIIFKEKDVQIRCGIHHSNPSKKDDIVFNGKNGAFIKSHYDDTNPNDKSTTILVADKLALIGNKSKYPFKTNTPHDLISEEEINRIMEEAFSIPYGEKVVELFNLLINAFKTHTHPYTGLRPCQDITYQELDKFDLTSILSESVKLN